MKVLKCRCSDEEVCSDAYEFEPIHKGHVLKVKCTMKKYKLNEEIKLAGENKSAEDADDDGHVGEEEIMMFDILKDFHLVKCEYIYLRKHLTEFMKDNMETLKKYIKDDIDEKDLFDKKTKDEKEAEFDETWEEFKVEINEFFKWAKTEISAKHLDVYTLDCDCDHDMKTIKAFFWGVGEENYMYFLKPQLREESY
jgi:nicotinamide mononucleotide adenylyltransferase